MVVWGAVYHNLQAKLVLTRLLLNKPKADNVDAYELGIIKKSGANNYR